MEELKIRVQSGELKSDNESENKLEITELKVRIQSGEIFKNNGSANKDVNLDTIFNISVESSNFSSSDESSPDTHKRMNSDLFNNKLPPKHDTVMAVIRPMHTIIKLPPKPATVMLVKRPVETFI